MSTIKKMFLLCLSFVGMNYASCNELKRFAPWDGFVCIELVDSLNVASSNIGRNYANEAKLSLPQYTLQEARAEVQLLKGEADRVASELSGLRQLGQEFKSAEAQRDERLAKLYIKYNFWIQQEAQKREKDRDFTSSAYELVDSYNNQRNNILRRYAEICKSFKEAQEKFPKKQAELRRLVDALQDAQARVVDVF